MTTADNIYKTSSVLTGIAIGSYSFYDFYNAYQLDDYTYYIRGSLELLASGFLLFSTYLLDNLSSTLEDLEDIEEELLDKEDRLNTYRRATSKIKNILNNLDRYD